MSTAERGSKPYSLNGWDGKKRTCGNNVRGERERVERVGPGRDVTSKYGPGRAAVYKRELDAHAVPGN